MSCKNPFVGSGIRKFRESLGLMQKDFAPMLGISSPFLSEIESGRKNPNIDLLTTFANEHDINITFLFTGKGSLYNQPANEKSSPEEQKQRRRFLGEEMVRNIFELNEYVESSSLVRNAVINFFRLFLHSNNEVIEEEAKAFKEMIK